MSPIIGRLLFGDPFFFAMLATLAAESPPPTAGSSISLFELLFDGEAFPPLPQPASINEPTAIPTHSAPVARRKLSSPAIQIIF
jgi:hypothetical protein